MNHHPYDTKEHQQREGDDILQHNRNIDGCYAEKDQEIGAAAAHAADDSIIHIFVRFHGFQHKMEHDSHQKTDGKAGQTQAGHALEVVGQQIAQTSGNQNQHQMPGQRIDRHGRDRLLAQSRALALLDQACAHIVRQLSEILHKFGVALHCTQLDERDPTKNAGQNPNRGAGHAQIVRGLPAQSA